MLHPFAHLNSNIAAERFTVSPRNRAASRTGESPRFPAPARTEAQADSGFVRASGRPRALDSVRSSRPSRPSGFVPASASVPGRSRSGGTPPVAVPPESPPPSSPPEPPQPTTGTPTPPVDPPEPTPPEPPTTPPAGPPRFESVPESARYPLGPYRQAPAEYGGEWWLVSPFTGDTPWAREFPPPTQATQAPPEFVAVFGERPSGSGPAAQHIWDQNLEHFQGVGVPEGFSAEQVEAAGDVFEEWGLGRPVFAEGRYGWSAHFPGSQVEGFQASPFTAIEAPHLVVARYQIRMTQDGGAPTEQHPFVPPQVFGGQPLQEPLQAS